MFEYVKPYEKYHIVLRRVGSLAGKCYKIMEQNLIFNLTIS